MNYQDMQTEENRMKRVAHSPNGLSRDGMVVDGDILVTCWTCGELADPAFPDSTMSLCAFCHKRDRELAKQEMDSLFCSICDGMGHGYPGGGPCPLESVGWMETMADEAYEQSMGVVSFEDAFHEARYERIGGERLG